MRILRSGLLRVDPWKQNILQDYDVVLWHDSPNLKADFLPFSQQYDNFRVLGVNFCAMSFEQCVGFSFEFKYLLLRVLLTLCTIKRVVFTKQQETRIYRR